MLDTARQESQGRRWWKLERNNLSLYGTCFLNWEEFPHRIIFLLCPTMKLVRVPLPATCCCIIITVLLIITSFHWFIGELEFINDSYTQLPRGNRWILLHTATRGQNPKASALGCDAEFWVRVMNGTYVEWKAARERQGLFLAGAKGTEVTQAGSWRFQWLVELTPTPGWEGNCYNLQLPVVWVINKILIVCRCLTSPCGDIINKRSVQQNAASMKMLRGLHC